MSRRGPLYFGVFFVLLLAVGWGQSWNVAFGILNMCLISAIMSLGVNIQWGYAGLFNVGIMGFTALGGLAAVLISMPPVSQAWDAGGEHMVLALIGLLMMIGTMIFVRNKTRGKARFWLTILVLLFGIPLIRLVYSPAVERIESIEPALSGYLGGLGWPILLSWVVGGMIAASAGWLIGKITLGLRADYLAIATLGISEIILAVMKYEEWLTRGVKNITGLPRPVPYEVDLIASESFRSFTAWLGVNGSVAASIVVKLCYTGLFVMVLALLLWLSERALKSPWGRMMRAIRDNRDAASAMGKDVKARHLQVFVLGCAVCGIAGAMLITLDGQLTPTSYTPLRFTFLIWVMVIIGGSGNNWGSVLGGFVIWYLWIQAEPLGNWFMQTITLFLQDEHWLKDHLLSGAAHTRHILMGLILLLVMRFAPRGLIPER